MKPRSGAFARNDDPARLHFGAAAYEEGAMVIPVEAQTSGRYALVLMGTGIAAATGSVRVGETDAVPVAAGPDTILLTTRIDAPGTTIRLPIAPDPRYRYADPTPLFFIAGVERTRLADYFAGPALNGFPRDERRACRGRELAPHSRSRSSLRRLGLVVRARVGPDSGTTG